MRTYTRDGPTRIAGTYIMDWDDFISSTDAVRQAGA